MRQALFAVYQWVVVVPVVGITTAVFGVLSLVLGLVAAPATVGRWCARPWAKINAFFAFMGVSVEGGHHIRDGRSYVVVSNHQSQFDILVVAGWLDLDFRWVMKKELRKVPVLGISCEKLGYIFIDRSDRQAAIGALKQAREKIAEGASIFFFPEGTRSRNGCLLPFKKGAFRTAIDLQLPILPVSIAGTHRILPPDSLRLRPGQVRLAIHAPIETAGCGPEKIPELIGQVREMIGGAS